MKDQFMLFIARSLSDAKELYAIAASGLDFFVNTENMDGELKHQLIKMVAEATAQTHYQMKPLGSNVYFFYKWHLTEPNAQSTSESP